MKNNWKPISDFAKIRRGASPRPIGDPSYFGGVVGWVKISDVTSSNKFLKKTKLYLSELGESKSLRVDKGDLVMSICGTIGRPIIIDIPACIHDGFVQLYDIKDADLEYLYYILQFSEKGLERKGQPGTQVNLNTTIVGDYFIYAPSLPQQQKIAKILTTVDNVIEQTESTIAKYQAMKQGMMHDLFTRGIDVKTGKLRPTPEDAQELYKESDLGLIPREWEVINFEEATEIITDFTANGSFESLRINVKYFYEVNYGRLIRLTDLRQNLKTDGVYVDKSGFDYLAKSALRENDIMLANVGEYTGFACLMPKVNYPATMAPNMFLVRTNQELFDSKFMYYFMTYPSFTNQVDNVSASSATKLLNKTNFRAMHLPMPEIDEQKLFGISLESITKKIQTEQQALSKYQQIKVGLMQDLLSGKVEVSVGEEIDLVNK
jgi:type I restriction enzyme S subunit